MILKWAYGHEVGKLLVPGHNTIGAHRILSKKSDKYVHQRSSKDPFLAYFDPPRPGQCDSKLSVSPVESDGKPISSVENEVDVREYDDFKSGTHEMLNLKELDQPVKLGEYFGGPFVMSVAGCDNIVNMNHSLLVIGYSLWLLSNVTVRHLI